MFKRKKKGQIVISLGDDGAILTCFENNLLIKRLFVSGPFSAEFTELVEAYPTYPIYILLDTIDQNYVFSNFPALRSGNLMKMVNRKITNEFDPSDINSYLCLGKDEESVRKDLKYVFISIRNSSPLSDWLGCLQDLPNKFLGIYLCPIESEGFIEKLEKKFPKEMGEGHKSKWRILISHDRVGGFRQVVYKDGKIIFTRISQAGNIQSPDYIGVNISQEAANTLEYIRRIGFVDNSLVIYVVCMKEAFQFIEIPGVEPEDVSFVTPFDAAQELSLKSAALEGDKFGDVVFASYFLQSKKKLKIITDDFKKVNNMLMVEAVAKATLKSLAFFLPLLILFMMYSIYVSFAGISEQEDLSRNFKRKISSIRGFEEQFGINPDFLVNMVKINSKITKNDKVFSSLLKRFLNASKGKALATSVDYKKGGKNDFTFTVFVALDTKGLKDYADLIIKTQEFSKSIREEFSKDYKDITFSNMPSEDNIKFDSVTDKKAVDKDISVMIKGRLN